MRDWSEWEAAQKQGEAKAARLRVLLAAKFPDAAPTSAVR